LIFINNGNTIGRAGSVSVDNLLHVIFENNYGECTLPVMFFAHYKT